LITSIPVQNRITIVNTQGRYTNSHLKHDAADADILRFAKAVNTLHYHTPAERFIKSQRYELKAE